MRKKYYNCLPDKFKHTIWDVKGVRYDWIANPYDGATKFAMVYDRNKVRLDNNRVPHRKNFFERVFHIFDPDVVGASGGKVELLAIVGFLLTVVESFAVLAGAAALILLGFWFVCDFLSNFGVEMSTTAYIVATVAIIIVGGLSILIFGIKLATETACETRLSCHLCHAFSILNFCLGPFVTTFGAKWGWFGKFDLDLAMFSSDWWRISVFFSVVLFLCISNYWNSHFKAFLSRRIYGEKKEERKWKPCESVVFITHECMDIAIIEDQLEKTIRENARRERKENK